MTGQSFWGFGIADLPELGRNPLARQALTLHRDLPCGNIDLNVLHARNAHQPVAYVVHASLALYILDDELFVLHGNSLANGDKRGQTGAVTPRGSRPNGSV